jgi:tRNA(His) guanylyltransferase
MNFDVLDAKMRVFEESHDQSVLPGIFMVARLDGRGFTGLTKERHSFQAPFDERFRDMMAAATEHVMTCGVRAVFGYTQSDEISVLLHRDCDSFSRKLRKLTSILAGEASAKFSLLLSDIGAFDCRISQLPSAQEVVDYFRWRQEDAGRNALNAHCYWLLRKEGQSVSIATGTIKGLSVSAKNELLFKRGINFNDLPAWQKRGIGMKWEEFDKEGVNPKTGQVAIARRRRLHRIMDLPRGDEYTAMLRDIAAAAVAE